MLLRCACILLMMFAIVRPCAAFEWVALHEWADSISLDEALEDLRSNPGAIEQLYVVGLVYLNRYETALARDAFERMLARDPQSIEAQWGVAEVLRREHRHAQSEEMLTPLIRDNPGYAPPFLTLAYMQYVQGLFNESTRLAGKVINLGRDNVNTSNYIRAHGLYAAAKGMIAHYAGPLSKAINGAAVLRHLNIIKGIDPDAPVVQFGFGSYYMLIPPVLGRNLDKARALLEKTIEGDPLFPDPYVRLAQIYKEEGNAQEYQRYLDMALSLDPQNELALDIQSGRCRFICFE